AIVEPRERPAHWFTSSTCRIREPRVVFNRWTTTGYLLRRQQCIHMGCFCQFCSFLFSLPTERALPGHQVVTRCMRHVNKSISLSLNTCIPGRCYATAGSTAPA